MTERIKAWKFIPLVERDKPKVGSETPWGAADWINEVTEDGGILFVGTPSHGGYWLSAERLAKMPPELRKFGTKSPYHPDWEGWFEEDCEWGAVALAFPEEFTNSAAGWYGHGGQNEKDDPSNDLGRRICKRARRAVDRLEERGQY